MASIALAALMPHAPVLVPAVGRGRESEAASSVGAMREVAREAVAIQPQAIVIISPHTPRHPGAFGIWSDARIRGTFANFGAPGATVDLPNDFALAGAIEAEARARGLATWPVFGAALDHGAMVPLWFLAAAGWAGPTVLLSLPAPGIGGMAQLGEAIRAAVARLARRTVVIASGDMSHRLKPGAPAGYDPRAAEFDRDFIERLSRKAYREISTIDPQLQALAAEDVVDTTLIGIAAAGWDTTGARVLSYEGPFGVGYGVAVLCDPGIERTRDAATPALPGIARRSIETAFSNEDTTLPENLRGLLNERHGVFVTLHKNGGLRGCVGSILPTRANIVEETWHSARNAAFGDRRFPKLAQDELAQLTIDVSLLHPPEPVASIESLDPRRYGVVVTVGDRRGLLLPDLPGVETVQQQLGIACQKAGIIPGAQPLNVERFEVEKFSEEVK